MDIHESFTRSYSIFLSTIPSESVVIGVSGALYTSSLGPSVSSPLKTGNVNLAVDKSSFRVANSGDGQIIGQNEFAIETLIL